MEIRLKARVEKGRLKEVKKIYQAIGRLQERYPRVARYYRMDYDAEVAKTCPNPPSAPKT